MNQAIFERRTTSTTRKTTVVVVSALPGVLGLLLLVSGNEFGVVLVVLSALVTFGNVFVGSHITVRVDERSLRCTYGFSTYELDRSQIAAVRIVAAPGHRMLIRGFPGRSLDGKYRAIRLDASLGGVELALRDGTTLFVQTNDPSELAAALTP